MTWPLGMSPSPFFSRAAVNVFTVNQLTGTAPVTLAALRQREAKEE
jgi:hypothetical protein